MKTRSELEHRLAKLIESARTDLGPSERERLAGALRAAASSLAPTGAGDPGSGAPANAGSSARTGRFEIVGESPALRSMLALVDRIAATDVPVLIRGETGSGKEGVARRLHSSGPRASGPFVAIDCGAIAATLIESELFGHVRGSFTGADRDRPGHFVSANGGTLLLDEVGELPLDLQPKLLRVLQEGEVRPVGGSASSKVDVRVLAATNRDLERCCREGTFRQDLYYRLAVVEVVVPPLRDRLEDLPLLVEHLLARIGADGGSRSTGTPPPRLSPAALERLAAHSWPGNVRELENALRRAAAMWRPTSPDDELGPEDFADALGGASR